MTIKCGVGELVGRTVRKVIVADNPRPPQTQVFLVLDDGTYYELYGAVSSASARDRGGEEDAERYARRFGGTITKYG